MALFAENELFGTVVTWPVSCTPAGSPALSELLGALMKGRIFTQKVQHQILMVRVTRLVGTDDMVYKRFEDVQIGTWSTNLSLSNRATDG